MGETPDLAVVMDWGGTWARASVADRGGNLLWTTRQPNAPGGTKDQLLSRAETVLQQAIDWCEDTPIAGIGIAAAGPIDIETGTFHEPPNLGALDGVSLKQLWEPKWGHQVFIGNDATLAALGEYHYGAGIQAPREGRPARTLVYVTVSTGIGGGVIDRGHMLTGAEGMAAEVGHMTVDPSGDAPQCQCGNYGCLEALASGTAVAKMARARLSQPGVNSTLSSFEPAQVTGERVFNAACLGDPLALDVRDTACRALTIGLANLLHLFNPDIIVLGGGVTKGLVSANLLEPIREGIAARAMSRRHQDFQLVPSTLGESEGMVGAASLVFQNTPPPSS